MTKDLRKVFGIKLPFWGKYRGKMMIPHSNYPPLAILYVSFVGYGYTIGGDEILGIDP